MDYSSLSDVELRSLAKKRGLPAIGRRQDLIKRLTNGPETSSTTETSRIPKASSPVKSDIADATSPVALPRARTAPAKPMTSPIATAPAKPMTSPIATAPAKPMTSPIATAPATKPTAVVPAAAVKPRVTAGAVKSVPTRLSSSPPAVGDDSAYKNLKVAELKELLGSRGLSKTGNKSDLIKRLVDADQGLVVSKSRGAASPDNGTKPIVKPTAKSVVPKKKAVKPVDDDEIIADSISSVDSEASSNPEIRVRDYNKYKVSELKDMLRDRNLKLSGAKGDLVTRLQEYDEENGINSNSESASSSDITSISDLTEVSFDVDNEDESLRLKFDVTRLQEYDVDDEDE